MTADPADPVDAAQTRTLLAGSGYLADDELATAVLLALDLRRPLLLEGAPGTGKTALATSLAAALGLPLHRLQCYEGIDATHALYDWDFARQILHLRTLEATGAARPGVEGEVEAGLYDERFLLARPVLQALRGGPSVLLVDEIDRADDEFEATLLEVLAEGSVTVPELGTFTAEVPPIVVLTSNRTRDLHDALKRRCLYHWIEHPDAEREVAIVRARAPQVADALATEVVGIVQRLRADVGLVKPPGVAETLDWARALARLGGLDPDTARATLGVLIKRHDDLVLARRVVAELVS